MTGSAMTSGVITNGATTSGGAVSGVLLLAGRTLRRFLRTPQLLIAAVVFPVVLLFVMLALFNRLVGQAGQGSYVDRLTPLIVLSTISFAVSITAVGFHLDVRGGFFGRLRSMPLPLVALPGGRLVGDLVRILLVAAAVSLLAYLPGFRFRQGLPETLGYFGVVALVGLLFTTVAICVGLHASSPMGAQNALNIPAMVVFFLSSGFLPVANFPAFVRPVVEANPLSLAADAMRGLASDGPVQGPLLWTLAWCAGGTAVAGFFALRKFRAVAR